MCLPMISRAVSAWLASEKGVPVASIEAHAASKAAVKTRRVSGSKTASDPSSFISFSIGNPPQRKLGRQSHRHVQHQTEPKTVTVERNRRSQLIGKRSHQPKSKVLAFYWINRLRQPDAIIGNFDRNISA